MVGVPFPVREDPFEAPLRKTEIQSLAASLVLGIDSVVEPAHHGMQLSA
jgi:hypothetical protein